jgi:hypothetical protein
LLALQRELAQLKRTPSMHLLARQRIPRLEAEIKQLVVVLQESGQLEPLSPALASVARIREESCFRI